MRYKRILLVTPPYKGSRVRSVFCAGLGYIAQTLEDEGLEYEVLNLSAGGTFADFQKMMVEFRPDLIGLSVMTYRYKDTYAFIADIKKFYPSIPVLAGGPHISLFREQVLRDCPALDFGAVMGGERTIVELCRGDDPQMVPGLLFRLGAHIRYSGDRPWEENLDDIPFPKYHKFDLDKSFNKEINALPVVSSRGCPFACIYCPVKCSVGTRFRARSPENIIAEIRYWYDRGYRRFSFADDNFTLIRQRVQDLCGLIKQNGMTGLLLSCDNGIRADRVDRELLGQMREAGFYRIAFGVEAGNDKVLKNLNKSEDIATIKERIREACDLDYEVDLFFLVGSPGETMEDLEDSFRIAMDYPVGAAYFYNIIPFPGTALFEWIKKHGRFLIEPEEYLNFYPILDNIPVFETPDLPYRARKKALSKAFAVSRKTQCRTWKKRLARLGPLAGPAAFVYTSRLMQDVILRVPVLRAGVYRLADLLIRPERD